MLSAGMLVLAGAAFLGGCTLLRSAEAPAAQGEQIVISMGPCFGFCPVYMVSLSPDGLVRFDGLRHTAVTGPQTRTVPRSTYEEVRLAIAPLRPSTGAEREWPCPQRPTDTSQLTLEWLDDQGHRTVLRYGKGCPTADGEMIERLVDHQLEVLGVAEWARQETRPGVPRG